MIVRNGGYCRLLVAVLFVSAVALRLWDPGIVQAIRFAVLGRIDAMLPPVPVRPAWAVTAEIAAVAAFAVLLAWLAPRLRPSRTAFLGAVSAALMLIVVAIAGGGFGLLLDPTWPLFASIAITGGAVLFLHYSAELKREQVRGAFGNALSRRATNLVAEQPALVSFAGTRRELTAMSAAFRDLGALAPMTPEAVGAFLRPLNETLAGHIKDRQGMLQMQSGDRLLALFNAPLDDADHTGHAIEAAIRMGAAIDEVNVRLRSEAEAAGRKFVRLHLDVGIDTGECITGNLTSDSHAAWTAIGPCLGTSARIGALCRDYGVPIILSEGAAARLSGRELIEVDFVRMAAGGKPARIFTLLEPMVADAELRARHAAAHARMIAAYRGGDWAAAEVALGECRSFRIEPLATLYSLYRTRIATAREIEPPAGWEGADARTLDEREAVMEVTPADPTPRHSAGKRDEGA